MFVGCFIGLLMGFFLDVSWMFFLGFSWAFSWAFSLAFGAILLSKNLLKTLIRPFYCAQVKSALFMFP